MYDSWFGLSERPFSLAPQLDAYFPANDIESACNTLKRCVERGIGPGIVIGRSGTGKTILCHALADEICPEQPLVVVESTGITSRQTLLQSILFGLGREYRHMDGGELRLSLTDYLTSSEVSQNRLVVIVDDAHGLPEDVCEEVLALSNLVRDGNWCVNFVLAGKPQLEEMLSVSRLESLNQKVVARCFLNPLSCRETIAYVAQHINRVGGEITNVFTSDALDQLHEMSGGIPRLINQICDHVLLLAAIGQVSKVNSLAMQEAWADFQQLPGPSQTSPDNSTIIEFGSLPPESPQANEGKTEHSVPISSNPNNLESIALDFTETEQDGLFAGLNEPVAIESSNEYCTSTRASEFGVSHGIDDSAFTATELIESPDGDNPFPQSLAAMATDSDNPFLESFQEEEFVVDDLGAFRNSFVPHCTSVKTDQIQRPAKDLENYSLDTNESRREVVMQCYDSGDVSRALTAGRIKASLVNEFDTVIQDPEFGQELVSVELLGGEFPQPDGTHLEYANQEFPVVDAAEPLGYQRQCDHVPRRREYSMDREVIREPDFEFVSAGTRGDLTTEFVAELIRQVQSELETESFVGDVSTDENDMVAVNELSTIHSEFDQSDDQWFVVLSDGSVVKDSELNLLGQATKDPPKGEKIDAQSRYGRLFANIHRKFGSTNVKKLAL